MLANILVVDSDDVIEPLLNWLGKNAQASEVSNVMVHRLESLVSPASGYT